MKLRLYPGMTPKMYRRLRRNRREFNLPLWRSLAGNVKSQLQRTEPRQLVAELTGARLAGDYNQHWIFEIPF